MGHTIPPGNEPPENENCKYVVQLLSGDYVYDIKSTDVIETCKSRIRARQFNQQDALKVKRVLKCRIVPATWERVP